MRLTVLGSGASCPPAGQNCSGYLVEDAGSAILLDCGNGIASALLQAQAAFRLDHIIISHMHADHFIDVLALRFRLTRDMRGTSDRQVRLHLPPGGIDCLQSIQRAISFPDDFCSNTFIVQEYDPDAPLALGDVTARFAQARHYIPAWSVRLDGSASLAYSGDTAPTSVVADLAQGADLFICEATLSEAESGDVQGHLTPEQAARLACAAQVKRLLLTHFWCGTDTEEVRRRARTVFTGALAIASDGLVLEL